MGEVFFVNTLICHTTVRECKRAEANFFLFHGLVLQINIFAHGQLYTAFSRAKDMEIVQSNHRRWGRCGLAHATVIAVHGVFCFMIQNHNTKQGKQNELPMICRLYEEIIGSGGGVGLPMPQ